MKSRRSCVVMLLLSAFFGVSCLEHTPDVGSAQDASSDAPPGDSASCRNVPLPPTQPAPESIVGTWLLDSFDAISSSSPGSALHIQVSRKRPLLSVTFAANGTWQAARCGDERYDATCSAWCEGPHGCTSGTYTYENGQLESGIGNLGKQAVFTMSTGLAILHFWGTNGWSNFVKIDHLTPCQ